VDVNISHIFEIPGPNLSSHSATYMALQSRQIHLSTGTERVHGPVQLSEHAPYHVSYDCEQGPKSSTAIILSDIYLILRVSNFRNLRALRAILLTFSLCVCRNGKLRASSENSNTSILFLDANFVIDSEISAN